MIDLSRLQNSLSSRYRSLTFLLEEECPSRLLTALSHHFPQVVANEWQCMLNWGGIYLNGKQVRSDCSLKAPCRIEYYEPRFSFENPHLYFPAFSPNWVIFEDEVLLICYKPPGLPSMPTREQNLYNLKVYLQAYIGQGTLHMPSRLDTAVGGLIVVSKSNKAHALLQKKFEQRKVGKNYLIEVAGAVDWLERECKLGITRDYRHPILRRAVTSGGKEALTRFRRLALIRNSTAGLQTSLISAQPLSGRTHQIRVHAQALGIPIIGDDFYGGRESAGLHMLSYRLSMPHPLDPYCLNVYLPKSLAPEWAQRPEVLNLWPQYLP